MKKNLTTRTPGDESSGDKTLTIKTLIKKTLNRKPSCKETPIERALLKIIGENLMIQRELARIMMIEEMLNGSTPPEKALAKKTPIQKAQDNK